MHAQFEPGRPVRLAEGIARLTAPNAGRMTGPGTNSYLLGNPPRAVLDPGPECEEHVAAILREAPDLDTVLVTHTHPDHSPATRALVDRAAAGGRALRVVGRPAPDAPHHDASFHPTHVPARDERIRIDDRLSLQAIDTPGHASNHICYLALPDGVLFSGDHVLDGVTPVILTPDGDMTAYLEALERLLSYPLRAIAPGHGRILDDPRSVIQGVIDHRLRREQKVLAALARCGEATLDELLPGVYSDVSPELYPMARHSLEAHLLKLAHEKRASQSEHRWHAG